MVGQSNVSSLSLNRLNQGTAPLATLIGKLVWIMADVRLESRAACSAVEKLLNVTGEDWQTVDIKYKDSWEGKLSTRVVMASNTLPRLPDSSGALAGRFVALQIHESFYGKEDTSLEEKLRRELPGILNWSLEGWARLREHGKFDLPPESLALQDSLYKVGSNVAAFLEECCIEKVDARISKNDLFHAYQRWCDDNGVHYKLTKATFGTEVAAAKQGVVKNGQRLSVAEGRAHAWLGITLKSDDESVSNAF